MDATQNPLEMLVRVVGQLGDLSDKCVFLGGAASSLFITDVASPVPRSTKDVDALVRCDTYVEYAARLGAELRRRGFREDDSEDAPMCRWVLGGTEIRVDFMPTNPNVLSLDGQWFEEAFDRSSIRKVLGVDVRIVAPPYFLATKIEAFNDRGMGAFLTSHDMEDIVAVVDGRPGLPDEVDAAPEGVRAFLRQEVGKLLDTPDFVEALPGHLGADTASQGRLPLLLGRLGRLAGRAQEA